MMRRGRSTDIIIGLGGRVKTGNDGIVIIIGAIDLGLKTGNGGERKMMRSDDERIDGGTILRKDVIVTMPPRRDPVRTIGLLNEVLTMRPLRRVVGMTIRQSVHDEKTRRLLETSIESNVSLEGL
jgi:hypothetical protein